MVKDIILEVLKQGWSDLASHKIGLSVSTKNTAYLDHRI